MNSLTYRCRQTWDGLFVEQHCEKYCVVFQIVINSIVNLNLKAHNFLKTSRSPNRILFFIQVYNLCSLAETFSHSCVQSQYISLCAQKSVRKSRWKQRNFVSIKFSERFSDCSNLSRISIKNECKTLQNFAGLYEKTWSKIIDFSSLRKHLKMRVP